MPKIPAGYTKEEWAALTPEQKEAHHKQKLKEWTEKNRERLRAGYNEYNQAHRAERNEHSRQRYRKMKEGYKLAESNGLFKN